MKIIRRVFNFAKNLDKRIKFLFVGGLNTFIGYGINTLFLLLVFGIPLDTKAKATALQIAVSSGAGHLAGMVNGYFCNKYFTFENKQKSIAEVVRFTAVSLLQLAISMALQTFLQAVLGAGIYVAMPLTLIITTVFSYVGHNYFTFRKKKTQDTEGGAAAKTEDTDNKKIYNEDD